MSQRDTKKPRQLEDIKTPKEFWEEITSGQLRWLTSILVVLNLGLLIWMWFDREDPEMYFPFVAKGNLVWIVSSSTLVLFIALAILNWRAWAKSRN